MTLENFLVLHYYKNMKFHKFSKKEKMAWWSSKTAEEQADYIFDKMIESGKNPNWDTIYTNVIKNGYYLK